MTTRIDVFLLARSRSRHLESVLARAAGEPELASRLLAEANALEERSKAMRRRTSEAEERGIAKGLGRMFGRIDGLKRRAKL